MRDVTSPGITGLLLNHGRTTRSILKTPLKLNEKFPRVFSKQSDLAELIRETKLIIWDEVPMMSKLVFKCVGSTLKDIKNNDMHLVN